MAPMRRRSLCLGICLGLPALLAACAPGDGLPPLPPAAAGPYRLGAGDKLRILTVADPALDGDFRISGAGDIELPMLGRFHAAGFTASGLAHALEYALRAAGLERAPSVAVEVVRYRPVFVLGEVNKAGAFPYQPGMTVVTAVALAGGFTYRAIERYAEVVRTRDGRALTARAGRNAPLAPGDVVTIFERRF